MSYRVVCWFRNDLRCADNLALLAAAEAGAVLPIYIVDPEEKLGGASRVWLHHSLTALNLSLDQHLHCYCGDPHTILEMVCREYGIAKVFWNRCYTPHAIARDTAIKKKLRAQGVEVASYNGALLWEPWEVLKQDGSPYKVFTPFYRRGCLEAAAPRQPQPPPSTVSYCAPQELCSVDQLQLLPRTNWYTGMLKHWEVGENGAQQRFKHFLSQGLVHYKEGRDYPALSAVSRLSPHLHFGEISPNQVYYTLATQPGDGNREHFFRELVWREFSYALLYHFPTLPRHNLQSKFDNFPWRNQYTLFTAWKRGETGIPIVDAGMRELWQTGYMHNRIRMVVGSFLVKNLQIDWRWGAAWFWDTLVDADLANNSASWQWVAGSGADAAPYFRIFNPITQGKKFDAKGAYTRRFVPELSKLPERWLFAPWQAPQEVLDRAGVVLGRTYPAPIVDLKRSRQEALQAFTQL